MLRMIPLPNGRSTSNLGFGCASLLRLPEANDRQRLLDIAVDLGITHFDVARLYGLGAAEAELGKLLRRHPGKLTVASKFGLGNVSVGSTLGANQSLGRRLLQLLPGIRPLVGRIYGNHFVKREYSVSNCLASLAISCQQLGVEHLDLYLIHGPDSSDSLDLGLEAALSDLRIKGCVGAYGISGKITACAALLKLRPNLLGGILQWEDDLSQADVITPIDSRCLASRFGRVRLGLPLIQKAFQAFPPLQRYWSDRLNIDLSRATNIAAALLAEALTLDPNSLVLYATTNPSHLCETVQLIQHPPWDLAQLHAFGDFWRYLS